ncbi:MAG: transcriptional activator NhaR [Planctomycetaceae bacterium]
MNFLNYHHLLYFWMTAREGTIQKAAARLHVGQPAISTQLRQLEKSLGQKLFRKSGRTLELTETGRIAWRYADEIFSLGQELTDAVRGYPTGQSPRFAVGVVDALPKLMARRLLEPALQLSPDLRLICTEENLPRLLEQLTAHQIDLVLSDSPVTASMNVRAFNHPLGDSAVGLFGVRKLARRVRADFPQSLNNIPLLLPDRSTALRRSLDGWLQQHDLHPLIRGEFSDKALMKAFGLTGEGLFPGTMAIADEICRQYDVELAAELPHPREQFFAISAERRIKHPAVLAITSTARKDLFL